MPPKILFRLGLSFLAFALAVYFSADHWLSSRIFVPLDYPVSLDAPQLKSPSFQINLSTNYFASLDLDYSVDDWYQDNRCTYKNILYPQWRLYKLGANSAQPRDLWVSSEQLSHQGFLSTLSSLLPADTSWSGIFPRSRPVSTPGTRASLCLPIPLATENPSHSFDSSVFSWAVQALP
jgi:hypothetical protein